MIKRVIYFLLLLFLVADLAYSFAQHLNQPLDGDMAGGIVPAPSVEPILEDPFGASVITENRTYPNPNRFFSHWAFKEYFSNVPLKLQRFEDPVDSVYLASAIAKIITQAALIFLLAFYITGKGPRSFGFLLAAVLVTPLFQTNGYRSYMGIIDPSVTYTFFYALPLVLLLIYFAPLMKERYHEEKSSRSWLRLLAWIPLALVISLSGPLNPGIVLVAAMVMFPANVINNYRKPERAGEERSVWGAITAIPRSYWFYFVPVAVFSVYSLFIGRYNSVSIEQQAPLSELYSKLPQGVFNQFTQKLGFPLLFAALLINVVIIRMKHPTPEGKKILSAFKWIGIFALIYILLLPLGGAREYRPYVLRYDTVMPITLALMFIFGATTLFLLKNISKRSRMWYFPLVAAVLAAFTAADKLEAGNNDCEKEILENIASTGQQQIPLENHCTVLSWDKAIQPSDAEMNTRLLKKWNIIKESTEPGNDH